MIQVRRVYDNRQPGGLLPPPGTVCFLVERLWPRGMRKEALELNGGWLRDAAPSTALRRWFGHDSARWAEFRRRYREELDAHSGVLEPMIDAAHRQDIVLYYSARDVRHNSALVLKEYLESRIASR